MEMKHYLLTFLVRRNGKGTRKISKTFVAQDDTHARRRVGDELGRYHTHIIAKSVKLFVLFTVSI